LAPPTDTNRVRIDPWCVGRPIALAAIFAMGMSAFLCGYSWPDSEGAPLRP
jgi:hypothetical protein